MQTRLPGITPTCLPAVGLGSRADVESRIDGLMARHFTGPGRVAGAAVAVVKDGAPLFQKGYGVADVRTGTAPDPARTLFRVGSVSKLITWTALMQAWERGRLGAGGLDADVNDLIRPEFQIPKTFPEPVRIWNLLTHTAGFEENQLGYLVKRAPDPTPLATALAQHMPARVRPPTQAPRYAHEASYSGWGASLAGHIVAKTAGMSFDDYVEQEIFKPLGMTRSTFREPLPAHLAGDLAAGHEAGAAGFEPRAFEFLHTLAPDGALSTTAQDMGRFMLAHLGGGEVSGTRILNATTVDRMHQRSLAAHGTLNGATLGFCEWFLNGRRCLVHGGSTIYFSALLMLVPEEGTGIFLVFNTPCGMAPEALAARVAALFFPAEIPRLEAAHAPRGALRRYAGHYLPVPHSHTAIDKAMLLVGAADCEIAVTETPRGTLRVGRDEWGQVPDHPGVFGRLAQTDPPGHDFIAFVQDENSQVTHIVRPMAFDPAYRLRFWQRPIVHARILNACAVVFTWSLLWAVAQAVAAIPISGSRAAAWSVAALAAFANLAILETLWRHLENPVPLLYGFPRPLRLALRATQWVSLPLTGACVAVAVVMAASGPAAGVPHAVLAAASAAFLASLHHWNLIGERFA